MHDVWDCVQPWRLNEDVAAHKGDCSKKAEEKFHWIEDYEGSEVIEDMCECDVEGCVLMLLPPDLIKY